MYGPELPILLSPPWVLAGVTGMHIYTQLIFHSLQNPSLSALSPSLSSIDLVTSTPFCKIVRANRPRCLSCSRVAFFRGLFGSGFLYFWLYVIVLAWMTWPPQVSGIWILGPQLRVVWRGFGLTGGGVLLGAGFEVPKDSCVFELVLSVFCFGPRCERELSCHFRAQPSKKSNRQKPHISYAPSLPTRIWRLRKQRALAPSGGRWRLCTNTGKLVPSQEEAQNLGRGNEPAQ